MNKLEQEAEEYRLFWSLNKDLISINNIFIAGANSKYVQAEKIRTQIKLLEYLNYNWDLEGIHPGKENYFTELNYLKQKLKEIYGHEDNKG